MYNKDRMKYKKEKPTKNPLTFLLKQLYYIKLKLKLEEVWMCVQK